MANNSSAQDIIKKLNLSPHPEKGYYVETFRDRHSSNDRSHSTCIYYLLEGKSGLSQWHRVLDGAEIWHYYAGAPMQLSLSWNDGKPTRDTILGIDFATGQRPQAIVERGEWQHAKSLGHWTLVGCTVAPAFSFESFEMAIAGWEPCSDSATEGEIQTS
ncbi:Cupin, RmlC-type [Penicillium digitatum]|uniref:DUF985 domain-containing protein n=3 Tax=Penicillium digitatum TaxID=36651 RepID=K9FWR6_PEND2|nr:hypothetical protein PDIP_87190 [Penicillium digitatum Pd1]EKV04495.1 hypothetical protein PDIP_87190 [Penicillium digitatum Pd1]EKV05486.1 hypothetical protein PDIG_83380 [Penicillium digitatum PHI26]KAG0160260.1 hypothetical protein PDIDSM_7787 [Penicillium digitatum]QQK45643.1 Cupin, RmlC-type [Penicillium digitatum]